ncbi:hypothetical protein [Chryseolinea lacunae]|uniref:Uncharacterized protein n=1 Tax=Chryseolinea lacunae TaxID=2801331 RepID=A0ABS1KVV0_9BACT|nr:hypothetical protein [Chryseolinea lacunae]MBL0743576.1 hypothetical protein [Chryseolinea lacunae]
MKYLVALFTVLLFGCDHGQPSIIDIEVHFLLKDKSGNNLYDSATVGHYHFGDIRVYYMDGDKKTEVYHSNYDAPRNVFSIQEGPVPAIIRFFPYEGATSQTEETINLIQWKVGDVDTVVTKIRKVDQSMFIDEVTINGKDLYIEGVTTPLVMFGNAYVDRLIELIK